jgi:hypothetical protein
MNSDEMQRRRELDLRRENEQKDLEVERTIGERPLEGLSGARTSWTDQQDDSARAVHEDDEERSRRASEEQIPEPPNDPD